MSDLELLGVSVGLLAAGALVSLLTARRRRTSGWASLIFVTLSATAIWALVARTFSQGAQPETVVPGVSLLGARLTVAVDPLSAFLLTIVATIAVLSTLFSVDYMTHLKNDSVAKFYPVLQLFFISLIGVLVSTDFLFFLVFWELMTLTSFFLVTFERESASSQRAGLKYFVITHAATLCMVAGALVLWAISGSFHFAGQRDALAALLTGEPLAGHLVILLLMLGFATKAGLLPMGDWLPDAHPVAPSGMSAMLSGVLVKLGVYGMIRLLCGFVPVSAALQGWGIALAIAGTVSLFAGTLAALQQTDSKRLMAFHTIGQIGYICLALGVGAYCLPNRPVLATFALMGGLFHVANHACFKACLFLGAGAVLYRTGERDMDRLGGLGADMPITAGSSTVASLSIAGVPPFNGFASKWLILATCLLLGRESSLFLVLGLVGLFVSLATLASFLKLLGAVFLGRPEPERRVREAPLTMTVPQLVLAWLCLLLGVFPQVPLQFIHKAIASVAQVAPLHTHLGGSAWGMTLSVDGQAVAMWAPLLLVVGVGVLAVVAYGIQRAGGAKARRVPVWTCGEEHAPGEVRYRARSFYVPLKHVFQGLYPSLRLRAPRFPSFLRKALEIDTWLYLPVARLTERATRGASRTHLGTPQAYLLWIVVGAVAVTAFMFVVMT